MVAHKILVSAPVPWIGDWGLGLDKSVSVSEKLSVPPYSFFIILIIKLVKKKSPDYEFSVSFWPLDI